MTLPDNFDELMRDGIRVEIAPGFYVWKSYADRVADGEVDPYPEDWQDYNDPEYLALLMEDWPQPQWHEHKLTLFGHQLELGIVRSRQRAYWSYSGRDYFAYGIEGLRACGSCALFGWRCIWAFRKLEDSYERI